MSDLLARLLSAGTPPDLVAEVAMELARAEAAKEAISERRYRDRQRQAEKRARDNVTSRDTVDVTGDPSLSLPPNENYSNPPALTHPDTKTRARKGTRLPVDWSPSPFTGQIAVDAENWAPGAIERELSKFRDWAASAPGERGVKSDWDAAWRNWLRRASDDGHLERNNGPAPAPRAGTQSGSVTERAMQRAAERLGIEGPRFGSQACPAVAIPDDDRTRSLPHARRALGDDGRRPGQLAYGGSG